MTDRYYYPRDGALALVPGDANREATMACSGCGWQGPCRLCYDHDDWHKAQGHG